MTLPEILAALRTLRDRYPVVRGRRFEFAALTLGENGDGTVEAWLAQPRTRGKRDFVALVMKGMPHCAWWSFRAPSELEAMLRGEVVPQWRFDDEAAPRGKPGAASPGGAG